MELSVRSPRTGELLASLHCTRPEELRHVIDQCRKAQKQWAQVPVEGRVRKLRALRETIAAAREELVTLISRENGKPPFEALVSEVMPTLDFLAHFEKRAPRLLRPRKIKIGSPLLPHRQSWIEHDPVGLIAIISPWNFPWLLPFCEVVTALLAGNAVIIKPSEVTPLTGLKIQEVCERAGLPKGLVSVIVGDGALGAELIRLRPDKIFFTGSVATGKRVLAAAAENLIPVNLELGGKDPMIVCADADLDLATSAAVWGSNFNSGQACASVERLLVHRAVAAEFSRLLVEKTRRLSESDLGAITFDKQKQVYEAHLADARAHGAQFLSGGDWSKDQRRLHPTIVSGLDIENAKVYNEETFGPVVALTQFATDEEAVTKANASRYGLTASVFSRDLSRARGIASKLETGTVTINEVLYTAGLPGTPWGGWKESGLGRTHHDEGIYDFVQMRHIHAPRWAWASFKSFWWFPYTRNQQILFESLSDRHRAGLGVKLRAWCRALRALLGLESRL